MNQTGVVSTGSRRHARRNRSFTSVCYYECEIRLPEAVDDQAARERNEIVEPDRLEAQERSQFLQLGRYVGFHVVVTRDDGHRDVAEPGPGAEPLEKVEPTEDRHPEIQNDRVGVPGGRQTRLGSEGGVHREPFEPQHPRERVSDVSVIVHDQDRLAGGAALDSGGGLTRTILRS